MRSISAVPANKTFSNFELKKGNNKQLKIDATNINALNRLQKIASGKNINPEEILRSKSPAGMKCPLPLQSIESCKLDT